MATISGLAPSTWEVSASEPTIRPVIGCLTGAPAHASSVEGIIEMFSAADEYDPACLDGRAEPVGAEGLFGEVEALHCVGPIHGPLVLRVDDAAGNDAAVLVGEEEGHPRIGEVRLPLVQDPACGAQNDAVRVDLPENLRVRPRDRCGTRPNGASSARSPWRRALAGTAARSRPSAINRSRALRTSSSRGDFAVTTPIVGLEPPGVQHGRVQGRAARVFHIGTAWARNTLLPLVQTPWRPSHRSERTGQDTNPNRR